MVLVDFALFLFAGLFLQFLFKVNFRYTGTSMICAYIRFLRFNLVVRKQICLFFPHELVALSIVPIPNLNHILKRAICLSLLLLSDLKLFYKSHFSLFHFLNFIGHHIRFHFFFRHFMTILIHQIILIVVVIEFLYFLQAHFLSHNFSPEIFLMAEFSILVFIFGIFQSIVEFSNLLLLLCVVLEKLFSVLTDHVSSSGLFDQILLSL